MGIAFSGVGIGSVVLFPWLQALIARWGWRSACWALAVLLLGLVPLNFYFQHRRPEDLGLAPDGDEPRAAAGPPGTHPETVIDPVWVGTLARAAQTWRFWCVFVGFFCGLFAWYAVLAHQTQYLLELGFAPATAAHALGLVGLLGIAGQIVLG